MPNGKGSHNDPEWHRQWRAQRRAEGKAVNRGGPPKDAAYFREYRARRKAENNPVPQKPRDHHPVDRSAEYEAERAKRIAKSVEILQLNPLFPDLAYGGVLSFWDDELAMDLRQERSLAELEGRDPDEAEREYKSRETKWWHLAGRWLMPE